jgi:hypothetical protein
LSHDSADGVIPAGTWEAVGAGSILLLLLLRRGCWTLSVGKKDVKFVNFTASKSLALVAAAAKGVAPPQGKCWVTD